MDLKAMIRHVSLEPVFFLFCVNLGLIMISTQDLYLTKACKVNLRLPEFVCDNLQNRDVKLGFYLKHGNQSGIILSIHQKLSNIILCCIIIYSEVLGSLAAEDLTTLVEGVAVLEGAGMEVGNITKLVEIAGLEDEKQTAMVELLGRLKTAGLEAEQLVEAIQQAAQLGETAQVDTQKKVSEITVTAGQIFLITTALHC